MVWFGREPGGGGKALRVCNGVNGRKYKRCWYGKKIGWIHSATRRHVVEVFPCGFFFFIMLVVCVVVN